MKKENKIINSNLNNLIELSKQEYSEFLKTIKTKVNEVFGENSYRFMTKPVIRFEICTRSPVEAMVDNLESKFNMLLSIDGLKKIRTFNENSWILTLEINIFDK